MLVAALAGCRPWAAAAASRPAAAAAACRSAVAVRVRAMAGQADGDPAAAAGAATVEATVAVAAAQEQQQQQAARLRNYPDEPRVGVGIVILRQLQQARPEVLLIRRAKEPSKGLWCFPGGSLELGESLVECAVRETEEETGVQLRNAPQEGEIFSDTLDWPSPVSSSDAMIRDEQGRLMYHYAIINLAAVPVDPHQAPVPADDVDAAQWFAVDQLRGLKDLVVHCDRVAERAVRQYTIQH